MVDIANSSTGYIALQLFLTGTATEATGKTVAITISKNGAAFGNPSAGATNATEIGNGWYYYAPSATDTGTNGILIVRGTAASCDNTTALHHVVPATNGRLSALPATAVTTNASLLTSGTGTDQLSVASGRGKADTVYWNAAAVSVPTNAGVPNVNVKTINDVATTAVTTVKAVQGIAVDGVITTVTNQLTAAQIATGVWQDTTAGDFTTAASIGKSIMNGVALGTGLTINGYTGNTVQTGDSFTRIGATGSGLTTLATAASIAALNNISSTDVATAVWNAATATYGTAGSYGLLIETNIDGTITSRATPAQVNAECDTALTDYAAATLEGTLTRDQAQRIILAGQAGKLSGAATATNTFRDTADSKNRIVSTCDSDGNRTAVTLDGS